MRVCPTGLQLVVGETWVSHETVLLLLSEMFYAPCLPAGLCVLRWCRVLLKR